MLTDQVEVMEYLDFLGIHHYKLIPLGVDKLLVDVDSDVVICQKNLTHLKVQFNRVNGTFDCSDNKLLTLRGSPKIVTEDFRCENNLLTTLEGIPQIVQKNIYLQNNELLDLTHLPSYVGGEISLLGNSQLGSIQDYSALEQLWPVHLEHKRQSQKNSPKNLTYDFSNNSFIQLITKRVNKTTLLETKHIDIPKKQ